MPTLVMSTAFWWRRCGRLEADDCYQETWLAALRAYPRIRDAGNLRGWLFTIANRKAIDHIRARKRAPLPVGAELPTQAVEDEHLLADGGRARRRQSAAHQAANRGRDALRARR